MSDGRAAETQDVTGSAAAAETGDTPVGAKRGRPKGSVNKTNRIAKQAILEAEPHSFLIRVMEGRKFRRAGEDGGRRTVDCYPSLPQSIDAAQLLLRKIAPDLRAQEITGADGGACLHGRRQRHRGCPDIIESVFRC